MDAHHLHQLYQSMNESEEVPLSNVTSTESAPSGATEQISGAVYYDSNYDQTFYSLQAQQAQQTFNVVGMQQPVNPSAALEVSHGWPNLLQNQSVYEQDVTYVKCLSKGPMQSPELAPLTKRPSISASIQSINLSDNEDSMSEAQSLYDDATERRKERRRAQNRAAQRAFRARKEETIKESSVRLEVLQDELARLQSVNGSLSTTVDELRNQVVQLQHENSILKRRSVSDISDWGNFSMAFVNNPAPLSAAMDYEGVTPMAPNVQDPMAEAVMDLSGGIVRTVQRTIGTGDAEPDKC